ncbi:MAG: hypothetical protein M3O87_06370 [Candidatus Dormibacteraeota bacterium]|nr:hypothetical protein [Candidatus Dormibacteraeota bacterium]
MSYTVLPDDHHGRGDIADLSLEAQVIYGISLTATATTEGFMVPADIRALARFHGIADPQPAIGALLAAELWEEVDGGYYLVGDDQYHRPKGGRPAAADPPRTAAAAKARAYRARRREVAKPVAQPIAQPGPTELTKLVAQPKPPVPPSLRPSSQPNARASARQPVENQDDGWRPPIIVPNIDHARISAYVQRRGWPMLAKDHRAVIALLSQTQGLHAEHFIAEWEAEMAKRPITNPWAVVFGKCGGIEGNTRRVIRRMRHQAEDARLKDHAAEKAIRDRDMGALLRGAGDQMAAG